MSLKQTYIPPMQRKTKMIIQQYWNIPENSNSDILCESDY